MFKGFTNTETFTRMPDAFFRQLLQKITDADELKVTLYALWRIEHIEGKFRALRETDFDAQALGLTADEIAAGLDKAQKRGSILKFQREADVVYFLNSPAGRAAAEAFTKGQWQESAANLSMLLIERPNIFKLYEENIGPLTPLIADALKDAEATYSDVWVADAIERAVKRNVRNWQFIQAALKYRKEKGHVEKQDTRDNQKAGKQRFDRKIEQLRRRSKK